MTLWKWKEACGRAPGSRIIEIYKTEKAYMQLYKSDVINTYADFLSLCFHSFSRESTQGFLCIWPLASSRLSMVLKECKAQVIANYK